MINFYLSIPTTQPQELETYKLYHLSFTLASLSCSFCRLALFPPPHRENPSSTPKKGETISMTLNSMTFLSSMALTKWNLFTSPFFPPDETLLDKTFYFKAAKRFFNIGLKHGDALTFQTLVASTKISHDQGCIHLHSST